jgi:hypothetical protein
LTAKSSITKLHHLIQFFVESKGGQLIEQTDEIFTIKQANQAIPVQYTHNPVVSQEKKITLLSSGSPAFQEILNQCINNGVLCQIQVNPKEGFEPLLKDLFRESPIVDPECNKMTWEEDGIAICIKPHRRYHQLNNGKIVSITITKKEPIRYFQFYYLISFKSKLRPVNKEIIQIVIDENRNLIRASNFDDNIILDYQRIRVQDFKSKIKTPIFDELKAIADQKLETLLAKKLVLFDLPLIREKKNKLRMFEKSLRREHIERKISRKEHDDLRTWQTDYERRLNKEKESLTTNVSTKIINLLVVNTIKATFILLLDNNATIRANIILGINHNPNINCPICHTSFDEGYATLDSFYVCRNCIKQSIETGKIYSKKSTLKLDETLKEYIEQDSGFICTVCGKKHSRLLEFKCNHDNSSICIHHYGLCDVCGEVFSILNLTSTKEFRQKLCPKHNQTKYKE